MTPEGAVAQLQAELERERASGAGVAAERLALREHLSGIVARLRPGLAAAGRDASPDPPVPLHELRQAEDIIERTSEYGGSRRESSEYARSVTMEAWGTSGAGSHHDSMAPQVASTPQNRSAADGHSVHLLQHTDRKAQHTGGQDQQDCPQSPAVPITPAKHTEAHLYASSSAALTERREDV